MACALRPLRYLCALLILSSFLSVLTGAQSPEGSIVARWETDLSPEQGWTVGDPIPLRLHVIAPAGAQITLPQLPERWDGFEVREQVLLDPIAHDDSTTSTVRETRVVLWAPGEYETPPFVVPYRDTDGVTREASVPPISIIVLSVLPEAEGEHVDEIEKKDLKPQASLPSPPVWPWLLAGTAVVLLPFFAARWLLQRRRPGRPEQQACEPVDSRFPEEIAHDELNRIAALDLPAQREFKRHYTLATDCVRTYIAGITGVSAMDCTTGELIIALRRTLAGSQPIAVLRSLLVEADLVKFAKFRPTVDGARAVIVQVRQFVDETKPERAAIDDDADVLRAHRPLDSSS